MSAREILVKARELISDPAGWTQYEYARNARGKSVMPESDDAVCFCSLGAILRVGETFGYHEFPKAEAALYAAAQDMGASGERALSSRRATSAWAAVSWLNDHGGHIAVLEMFDKAIESLG